jgi:hypothetical protein
VPPPVAVRHLRAAAAWRHGTAFARSISARHALWVLLVGLPIVGLSGEVLCAFGQFVARQRADEFRRHNPNAFAAAGARLGAARSLRPLWKKHASRYEPGAHLEIDVSGQRYVVDINSRGFRTKEFSERRPAGTIRVICIGGSTTFAGQTNDETYPAILEKQLQAAYPSRKIEVLNFGISGVVSNYWIKRANELFGYEPDIVVQYEGVNDILGALPGYARAHPWKRYLYRSLLLQRLLPIRPEELTQSYLETIDNQAHLATLSRRYRARHIAGSFAGPDYAAASVEMRGALDVSVADFAAYAGGVPITRYVTYAELLGAYNRLFEEAAGTERLSSVLVHRSLRDPRLFVDICHLNSEGIRRLAEAFCPAVRAAIDEGLRTGTIGVPYEALSSDEIQLASVDDRNLSGEWSPGRRPLGERGFRWALPPVSCVRIRIPDSSVDLGLRVTARAPKRCQPQTMEVLSNGSTVGSAAVPIDWAEISFVVPSRLLIPGENAVCLRFENAERGEGGSSVAAAVAELGVSSSGARQDTPSPR